VRKFYTLLIALFLVFGLVACGGNTGVDFPTFDEDNVVELSAQEMVTLFESIDYTTVDSESVRISTKGHIFVIDESDPEDTYSTWRDETKITIDAVVFGLISDTIGDVLVHAEGTVDFFTSSFYESEWYEEDSSQAVEGTMGLYFKDGYLYMNVDGTFAEDGADPEEAVFKQKLNQQVTQDMWDEAMGQADPDQIDNMVPQEILDMLESGDFDEIMDAVPNLKVYQDGNTYSIVFSITKSIALDSIEDLIVAYAEQMGETLTQAEIDEIVEEAETQINAVVEQLEFTYVISITGTKITQVAEMLVFKSVDGTIDIDLTTVIDFGVDAPKFPTDLDDYEPVDEPGEGIFDDGMVKE
jgi:Ca2+-binding EF-hand superfamily protein